MIGMNLLIMLGSSPSCLKPPLSLPICPSALPDLPPKETGCSAKRAHRAGHSCARFRFGRGVNQVIHARNMFSDLVEVAAKFVFSHAHDEPNAPRGLLL